MGAEGLEASGQNTGETAISENGGTPGGTQCKNFDPQSDSETSLKAQALVDLQRAWKSIRRMETLSDNQAETKVAERALAFVDKAFTELTNS